MVMAKNKRRRQSIKGIVAIKVIAVLLSVWNGCFQSWGRIWLWIGLPGAWWAVCVVVLMATCSTWGLMSWIGGADYGK